jgi:hypothetical protein
MLKLPPIAAAACLLLCHLPPPCSAAAPGPLRVLTANPRYFTADGSTAVYLTGSHTWTNFKDAGLTDPPPVFDFNAHLDFLASRKHNFIRLWVLDIPSDGCEGLREHVTPFPWPRSGPELANDGKPKFDLSQFDESYFQRLRARVMAAGDRGFYVSLMLFDGYHLQFCRLPGDGHPFDAVNNVQGLGPSSAVVTLGNPAILDIQKAYVRKVIDTVNDLDNVLYEIANEAGGASTAWQFEMINTVRNHQAALPKQHPVGMTYQWQGGDNPTLFASAADWISPGGVDPYGVSPPAATGSKVILNDSDHIYGITSDCDYRWVWRSFTRGLNPIFMDTLETDATSEGVRLAMGHTREYAGRMDLAAMTPQGALGSTGYCLAKPGAEYLVYQQAGGTFSVNLSANTEIYKVEWFNPVTGKASLGSNVNGGANRVFTPPFSGPAVLYLRGLTQPAEQPLTVRISSPTEGQAFYTPLAGITLVADATDRYDSISAVDFYAGETLIGSATSPPYSVTWPAPASGVHTLTARASSSLGATEISAPVTIVVGQPPALGMVTLTEGIVSLLLTGEPGLRHRVEVSDDLAAWELLQVAVPNAMPWFTTTGVAIVTDPQSVNHPKRFYRALLVP